MKIKFTLFKQFMLIMGLLTLITLAGCLEDEPQPNDEDEINLEAAFSFSPETPKIGDEINLDANASFDASNTGFEILWELTDVPEESEAALTNATSIETNFTPDKTGEYTVMLTLTADDGEVTDSETQVITVMPGGYVELSGAIDSDRVLENINEEDASLVDYLVVGNVNVSARLTIEPGVNIHFQEDRSLSITSSGTLVAEGTETDSIIFTSANEAGETHWKGLYIASASSENSLKYVQLNYAGNSEINFSGTNYKAGIGVESSGKVAIENSSFMNNSGYAVYIDDDGGELASFTNNHLEANENGVAIWVNEVEVLDATSTFVNNSSSDVEIFSSTIDESVETTWNGLSSGSAYTVSGNLAIQGTLTINEGARFQMEEDVMISVTGALIAQGSESNQVEFTTADVNQGLLWKGIYVNSADGRNQLDHVAFSYAGNSEMDFSGVNHMAGLGLDANGKMSITNCEFSNNQGYAVYVDDDGGQLETFTSNTFLDNMRAVGLPANEVDALDEASTFTNNANADVEIFASTYEENKATSWPNLAENATYRVSGNVYIVGDVTIDPGASFELDENVIIDVSGSISAVGTASDHIVFTSSNVSGGLLWKGIYISSASNLNEFDYVDVSYAGNSEMDFNGTNHKAAIGIESSGKVSVTNSSISDNDDYGLYIDNDGGQIENFANNSFSGNSKAVGLPADELDAIDGNTTFSNNSFAEVEVFGSTLADTKTVTWNALAGDAFYRVTGNLNLNGTVTVAPGASFEMDEDVQLEIFGAFIAEGTDSDRITFTTSNVDGGLHWKGFFFQSANSQNKLDYVEVSYGGKSEHDFDGANFAANVGVNAGAQLSITNSSISNSSSYGVFSIGTINNIIGATANNTFTSNVDGNSF